MNIIDFYKTHYKVTFLRILRQYWKEKKSWSCIGEPKPDYMFLYLDGCSTVYTAKDGKKTVAHSGDTLFIPQGMEYTAEFFDFQSDTSSAVNVNFLLCDEKGEAVETPDGIIRFSSSEVRLSINELERLGLSLMPVPTKFDIEIHKIFNIMCEEYAKEETANNGFEIIRRGVEYLHYHYNENIGISKLAEICSVSEVYFRKLFKKHLGVSPAEYRQTLRLEQACRYLRHSESSVTEIAEMLGFADTSYFVKSFKEHYGVTPLKYRKQSD